MGKYLIGLGHLIWGEKEQGGSIKASWLGVQGLDDSGQAEH